MQMFNNAVLFVEVAKTLSFRQAGKKLGISIATVSRRIAEMERELGLPLVNRTTRKVELTEAGLICLESCQRIADEERNLQERLSDNLLNPRGLIRLTAPEGFGLLVFGGILPEFLLRYPDIRLNLELMSRNVDLVTEAYDVKIQIGPPTEQNVVARKIVEIKLGMYASPEYLKKMGVPAQPLDLLKHNFLQPTALPVVFYPMQGGDSVTVTLGGQVSSNSSEMIHRLTINHVGISVMGEHQAAPELANQSLVQVLPEWSLWSVGKIPFHAVTTSRRVPARVRVFLDFLKNSFDNA